MKKIKFIFSGIALLFLMFGINELFHYLLIDDSRSYTRIMMHELYTEEENIDILFLGSSHCYRSLNPEVTDTIFNANTFNAGTSLQGLDGSYALLVEAAKNNDLKEVYVELYYGITTECYNKRTDLTSTYLISDYMKHSPNRLNYLLQASSPKHYVNSFILGRREWANLLDYKYLMDIYAKKSTPAYKNYEYIVDIGDAYMGKGYAGSEMKMRNASPSLPSLPFPFYENYISNDSIKSIERIINYCEKHNIKLTFFTAPMHDSSLMAIGNYDVFVNQMHTILSEHGFEYYDFNLCKAEYLNLTKDHYMEPEHLNINGAFEFSALFANYFTGKLTEDIFYESYNEKMSLYDTKIITYLMEPIDESSDEYSDPDIILDFDFEDYSYLAIKPIAYNTVEYEHKISLYDMDNDTYTLIQDWNTNNIVFYPNGEESDFYIETRNKNTGEILGEIYYRYGRDD